MSFLNKIFNRSGKKNGRAANNTTICDDNVCRRLNNTVCGAPIISNPPKNINRNKSNPEETTRKRITLGLLYKYITSPGKMKKQKKLNLNSSLQSEVPEVAPKKPKIKNIPSQVYEQSINKHGDVVEYAVPYYECTVNEIGSPILKATNQNKITRYDRCEGLIDDNFVNESKWNLHLGDVNEFTSFINKSRNTRITDLDKSSEGSLSLYQNDKRKKNNEVLLELDTLERWSENIPQRRLPPVEPSASKTIQIMECEPNELKTKKSILKDTLTTPLHFTSGIFRKTSVTLRKCCPLEPATIGLVEEAIERDYEILSKMKHSNIILLMAASFYKKSFDHMTLVLEQANYTLNYFLHQMDNTLSLVESISVVQQIASAALYLQESGYIHSNITSHNILVKEYPWSVKLSSFELTTEVDVNDTKVEIQLKYNSSRPSLTTDSGYLLDYANVEDQNIHLKEQYKEMSKIKPILKCSSNKPSKFLGITSKYLIYATHYREQLSLHNFQAPELLSTKQQFVFPTTKTDVYSLSLLLWEILNKCVPFVVYNKLDMERMIKADKLYLPYFEHEKCEPFTDIFRTGLAVNPKNRTIDVDKLITMLEDIKFQIRAGFKDAVENREHQYVNGIENENHLLKENGKCNSEYNIDNSTVSPSLSDFNKCLNENKLTSTLKKRKNTPLELRKSFQELSGGLNDLNGPASENQTAVPVNTSNNNISHILPENNESESKIIGPLLVREIELPSKVSLEKQKPMFKPNIWGTKNELPNTSPDVIDSIINESSSNSSKTYDTSSVKRKLFSSDVGKSSSGFNTGENSMQRNAIAIKNKIRRDAWLVEHDLSSSNEEIRNEALSMEKNDQSMPLEESKNVNVSIKIVHNKVTPNGDESPSVTSRIKFFNSTLKTSKNDLRSHEKRSTKTATSLDNSQFLSTRIGNLISEMRKTLSYSLKHSTDKNEEKTGELANSSILSMSPKTEKCTTNELINNSPIGQPQQKKMFENKFFKRKTEISKRSSCSNDDIDVITPKWPSVRDVIMKYERRVRMSKIPSSPTTTSTESVKNIRIQPNHIKQVESNHEEEVELNHNKEVKVNHEKEVVANNEKEAKSHHEKEVESNHEKEIEANHEMAVKANHEKEVEANQEKVAEANQEKVAEANQEKVAEANHEKEVKPNHEKEAEANHEKKVEANHEKEVEANYEKKIEHNIRRTASTLIKRTIYSESIVSGVDLSSLDNHVPLFDQLNLTSEKLTTCVTLNMSKICRKSTDLSVNRSQSVCGGEKGFLSRSTATNLGRCTCYKGISKDISKAPMFESSIGSVLNTTNHSFSSIRMSYPQMCCKLHTRNSIEDIYIDDDFDQGFGANLELQSDSFDFLNFDMI